MAKPKRKQSGKKAPTVTLRFANEGRAMAKKKTTRKSPRRKNPSKKKGSHRRRRNPGTFWERAGKLAAGAGVAVGTAVLVTYGQSKLMPGQAVTLYGLPALAFLAGVGIARTMPTLGVGMALGSFGGFAVPLTSKLLTATAPATPTTTQAAGIARAFRTMRLPRGRMGAIDMNAVDYSYAR